MPNRDDLPKKKPEQGPEHKPTAQPTDRPNMPDLGPKMPDQLPSAPIPDRPTTPPDEPQAPKDAPELKKAGSQDTRDRTGNIRLPDQMRDLLNRMDRTQGSQDDEYDPVIPQVPQNLPAIVSNALTNIGGQLSAAGTANPEWHKLNDLPGFRDAAVRGMGRDIFSMFTRTKQKDIVTIANVNGQGPNTDAEINAVIQWLKDNAEQLQKDGAAEIDYGMRMPGYNPKVIEFKTNNTRFHVVSDPGGKYIYAYPEADAVQHNAQDRLGNGDDKETHDEFGAPIKRLRENKMTIKKFTSGAEQIKHFSTMLENIEDGSYIIESILDTALAEALEMLAEASNLSKIAKTVPGGESVLRYLHRINKLSAVADYVQLPITKHFAKTIKANKDNFAILVGEKGMAAIKPKEEDWDNSTSKSNDTGMRYDVIWSFDDDTRPHIEPARKYRMGTSDGRGGSSGMEGGGINLFQLLLPKIGKLVSLYTTFEALERSKMQTRTDNKAPIAPTVGGKIGNAFFNPKKKPEPGWDMKGTPGTPIRDPEEAASMKLRPLALKMFQSTLGQLGPRIQRLAQSGNYDAVEKLTRSGKKLQDMVTALDTPNPVWNTNYNNPLRSFQLLVNKGIQDLTSLQDEESKKEFIQNLASGQVKELGELLNYVRSKLFSVSEFRE